MAKIININRDWLFCAEDADQCAFQGYDDSAWPIVSVPHTNKLFPHNSFDDSEYQFVSWYRKRITVPEDAAGKRVFIDFGAVMTACEVFVDGQKVTEHKGGYTPFSIDITNQFTPGNELLLAVRVDSTERPDIPPFGYMVDYLTFGGIYRDVDIRICNRSYIRNVFAYSTDVSTSPKLHADIEIVEPSNGMVATMYLKDDSGSIVAQQSSNATDNALKLTLSDIMGVVLWSIDNPYLYTVEVKLTTADRSLVDTYSFKFGFREARFCDDGLFRLNGEVLKLMGLNRHQTYPYIGQAAPARLQKRDADILKYELGLNIVRTSHYPQSPHFLDRCDEIGLLVFEEIPGWQHIGDQDWKEVSKQNVREMIIRDRNHPSIIMWGVRINESADDHDFYTQTNAIAHELDPTRQTGGVRCHRESEFLEDVFTFNEFDSDVRDPNNKPYIITEFGGHMFPTKSFDCEERRVAHALWHTKVQSRQMLDNKIAGAIGWCAFDYNTHASFGSGDRICYHGVCDIFRLPKWAAYVYASQVDPSQKVVLEVASIWTIGDRAGGGQDPTMVLTNCDSVKLYVGDTFRGEYFPAVREYPGLKHPPVIIRGLEWLWGNNWQDARFEGCINGQKVAETAKAADSLPVNVKLWVDSTELVADCQDMTALNFQIVDKYGHVHPYSSEVVTFAAEGPVDLIGTNPFAPQGGQGCIYIKAQDKTGKAVISASTPRLGRYQVEIELLKPEQV